MSEKDLDIPPEWEQIDLSRLQGPVMVIGAPDIGKTTFARYLFRRLKATQPRVAFLDGDPGQSKLGPPATLTMALQLDQIAAGASQSSRYRDTWRYFVGSTSPSGHMLPVLVGAARLVQAAYEAGARTVIYDTSGLVDPAHGGLALKGAKMDLLRPEVVFAIQRDQELEPLLVPWRHSHRMRIVGLRPSPAVRRRDTDARRSHRARQFARHFIGAHLLVVNWNGLAVFPFPRFSLGRLLALEDSAGFTIGLGIVTHIDRQAREVTLYTPLTSLEGVNALRLGSVAVDPETYWDEKIG